MPDGRMKRAEDLNILYAVIGGAAVQCVLNRICVGNADIAVAVAYQTNVGNGTVGDLRGHIQLRNVGGQDLGKTGADNIVGAAGAGSTHGKLLVGNAGALVVVTRLGGLVAAAYCSQNHKSCKEEREKLFHYLFLRT